LRSRVFHYEGHIFRRVKWGREWMISISGRECEDES
jgi:hypothetical protein